MIDDILLFLFPVLYDFTQKRSQCRAIMNEIEELYKSLKKHWIFRAEYVIMYIAVGVGIFARSGFPTLSPFVASSAWLY